MNARFFISLIAFVMFCATFESGTAATVQLPHLLPSPPRVSHDKEKQRLEARCPPLDPCVMGDYYMELFEKIRKGVNCPPQPQRCSTTTTTTTTSATMTSNKTSTTVVAQPATITEISPNLNNTVFLCQHLEHLLRNRSFLQMYVDVLKSLGCPTEHISTLPPVAPVVTKVSNTTVASAVALNTSTEVKPAIAKVTDTSVAPTIAKVTDTSVAPAIAKVTDNTSVAPAIAKITDTSVAPATASEQNFWSELWEQFLLQSRNDWSSLPQPSSKFKI